VLLGPGKADLLEAVRRTGSLREAAAALGMSYMRAWELVRTMNRGFAAPLVALERGGAHGGGATLTRGGERVLQLYRRMEAESLSAVAPDWRRLRRLLR
jgi:molybdate transport system regulatory protein